MTQGISVRTSESGSETEVGAVALGAGNNHAEQGRRERAPRRYRFQTLLGFSLGLALVWGAAGCHKTTAQDTSAGATGQNGADPADANMAPVSGGGYASGQPAQVLGQRAQNESQQQAEDYSQQPAAPIERRAPDSGGPPPDDGSYANGPVDNGGTLTDAQAADVYTSDLTDAQASDPPPPLPQYDQPPAPDPDYLWTPGYWSWGPEGYYWVPGCWVAAPYVGALWTPGYWGFGGGLYRFHHGYWGLHIGFYGGVDYGYGYVGHGYYGGYWNGGHFFYNTAVSRVNVNVIRNVYVHNVVVNNVVVNNRITNRVSFNGGRGGVQARPMAAEVAVLHEQRIPPMASQVQVQHEAAGNRQQLFNQNRGQPAVVVSPRPVVADRSLPAALPRAAGPAAQPGFRGEVRPGQMQSPVQGPHPLSMSQPQPQSQSQPGREMRNQPPASQARPFQQNGAEPQVRQARPQPEVRPGQPQPQVRPAPPQPQVRPAQPQPQVRQPQARPAPPPHPQPKTEPHEQEKPRS